MRLHRLIIITLAAAWWGCSGSEEPICQKRWEVAAQRQSFARIENGALVLSVTDPASDNDLKLIYPLEPDESKPGTLRCQINFENFNAGGNLSYDGFWAASIAYQKDPATPLFKIKMWEKYVEITVGSNYYTREITNRQARGQVVFTYGLASAEPTVGAVEYNPANETQTLRGNGNLTFTNDPLVLVVEVGGSNFTPASPEISLHLSEVAYAINKSIGTFTTETFDCNSLK